ncbi:MAG: HD domain-containing protein [Betaproteobacteria bacterium]|nr:HD domain-containing protein [Betaproteobacteria bacterium]
MGPFEMSQSTISARIFAVHQQLASFCPQITRIAVAIHDPITGTLRTFLQSTQGANPLAAYECALDDVPSLRSIAQARAPRVINDLSKALEPVSEHSVRILGSGYRSSYTVPMFAHDDLLGLLFFDADETDVFTPQVRARLDVFAQLISLLVAREQASIHTLSAAIRTAVKFGRFRDEETGAHLMRMSHLAQLIARRLPPGKALDDELAEFLLLFAPLHDIGKIAIPDDILRKQGPLSAVEMDIMRSHVDQGFALVNTLIDEFELNDLEHIDMLRNIVRYHHENFDGSGYNAGLSADGIPIEARIVKVADVFDALTSVRPYKAAWPVEEACRYLSDHRGTIFDPDCADALIGSRDEAMAIRRRFEDTP